ncbi:MAG TPA: hypothetical protein VKP00_10820 [Gemmatimonadaceae bacterium]|nr:hypothetical protein [Gemmatimonadaceae bacterium]
MRRQLLFIAVAALCAAALMSATLHAQGVVIAGSSSAQYVELRPLTLDSVALAQTDSAWGSYRRTSTGVLARCVSSQPYCTFFRSGSQRGLTAMMQDLDVTAWGFGQGLSFHTQLRARTAAGDGELWPQATQRFDAIALYLEAVRNFGRARLGRQWITSPLGVYNFDGAALSSSAVHGFTAEVYGGGSLIEGLNRPLDADALSPVEDLPPTDRGYLIGGTAQFRPSAAGALRVQYQREFRGDRAALYSERFAASGEFQAGDATLSGQLTRDMATGAYNDLSASVRMPIAKIFDGTFTARHYAPYFDLWTIWGAFSPVAFNEYGGDLRWAAPRGLLTLGANGAWRSYDDTHTGLATLPLRSDGWRVGASATLRPTSAIMLDGRYHVDVGFGASGSDGDVAVRWMPSDRLSFALHGMAFQTIDEFQVGEGRVFGAGAESGVQITPTVRAVGDLFMYRHDAHDQPQMVDWNQRRASIRLEWSIGSEPGWGWGGLIGKARDGAGGAP